MEAPEPAPTPLPDRGRGLRIGAYATTGVAVAALGAALGLFLWANSEYNTWDAENDALRGALQVERSEELAAYQARVDDNNALADRIETLDVASWVLLGVGAAATATAVTLFVLGFTRRGNDEPAVALAPAPRGMSLSLRW